jgi:hypothetical protein
MRIATALTIAACGLLLAACEQARTPTVDRADQAELLKPSDVPGAEAVAEAEQDPAKTIPTAIRGRWGLVPADCTSTRGDAKGLVEIDATTLRFYESRGSLAAIDSRSGARISARFDFAGEGETWSRDMTLALEDDGKTLVRSETGEGALEAALEYTRCT